MNDLNRLPAAAYVHIPFCAAKCSYCDFVSYPGQPPSRQLAYIAALAEEIRRTALWASRSRDEAGENGPLTLKTVYVGGGTPTVLDAGSLSHILEALDAGFGLSPDGEFTLEANPGTVSRMDLHALREARFNRISFGLQALQPHLLKTLGRVHGPGDFVKSVEMAEQAGFQNISADIMFGVPGQTAADLAETLDCLLDLPICHISFYALTLEEGTPLQTLIACGQVRPVPEELEREQYWLICRTLAENGFTHYEISNAAKQACPCRHNLVYWEGRPYYGFGAAAHSYVRGVRRANTGNLDDYIGAYGPSGCNAGEPACPEAFAAARVLEVVDEKEAQFEMVFLGLRLLRGVRFADFTARFGVDLRGRFAGALRHLSGSGLLQVDGQGIRLTEKGLDLANQVFMEFIKD